MSLAGLRDISVIETPPEGRRPVKTYVGEYDEQLVRQALEREEARGGQAFFLHNRVDDIDETAERLRALCPKLAFTVAHGQMDEKQLEERMMGFLRGDADVLVSTSIIESGIDIPQANTLIVDRADLFGLSQLYQIRGRVGRSRERAYAYLLYPSAAALTQEAADRLSRAERLHRARRRLQGRDARPRAARRRQPARATSSPATSPRSASSSTCRCSTRRCARWTRTRTVRSCREPVRLDVNVDAYVPADYIPYEQAKVDVHRRIAGRARGLRAGGAAAPSSSDRFGEPPEPLENLITLQQARIKLGQAGAPAVTFRQGRLAVTPIELDAARRAQAARGSSPARSTSPGRSQLSLRVPDDPAAAVPRGGAGGGRAAGGQRAPLPKESSETRGATRRAPLPCAAGRRRIRLRRRRWPLGPVRPRPPSHAPHDQGCSTRPRPLRLLGVGATVAACGGVPGNAVATVDGEAIDKTDFNHWLTVAAKSSRPGRAPPCPTRRTSRKCVAAKRKTTPTPAKGQPKVTDAQLKTQCKQEYDALRDQVLQLLISFKWIQGEADGAGRQGHRRRGQEVLRRAEEAELPEGRRLPEVPQELRPDAGGHPPARQARPALEQDPRQGRQGQGHRSPTPQIADFYNKNKARFAQPEKRDLRVVLTKTKAKAEQAKAALESGQSWATVAKKYSIDDASKAAGRQAARRRPRARWRRRSTTPSSRAKKGKLDRARSRPSSATTSSRSPKITPATPADAGRRPRRRSSRRSRRRTSRRRWTRSSRTSEALEGQDGVLRAATRRTDCKNGPKATPTPDRDGDRRAAGPSPRRRSTPGG